jgi:hypothetical protein
MHRGAAAGDRQEDRGEIVVVGDDGQRCVAGGGQKRYVGGDRRVDHLLPAVAVGGDELVVWKAEDVESYLESCSDVAREASEEMAMSKKPAVLDRRIPAKVAKPRQTRQRRSCTDPRSAGGTTAPRDSSAASTTTSRHATSVMDP